MSGTLFWIALILIVYAYILFPLLVLFRGLLVRYPYKSAEITPTVSLIVSAYNEAQVIAEKLENILALNYPRDRLEVLVASDGSDDGTDAIVRRYADQGVKLLAFTRQGKAQALNGAVSIASGEILIFSDANSMYAQDAIHALVRPFADPEVGGVVGDQRYLPGEDTNRSGDGEKSYWNFDRNLKYFQSKAGNVISATGAIYAIRHGLFQPVPGGVTDDFFISTGIIMQGFRLVFSPNAVAYEAVALSSGLEFRRKVRVITRGLRAVLMRRALLNPFRSGFYAIQLFSHKVLRRLVVFPLLALFLINLQVWPQSLIYQASMLAQVGFYSCALIGACLKDKRLGQVKLFTLPFYFCLVNTACVIAVMNVLRGHRIERWETKRQDVSVVAD